MDDDRIRSLLRKADESARLPEGGGDLANQVRRTSRRRSLLTGMVAGGAIALAIGIVATQWHRAAYPRRGRPVIASRPVQPQSPPVVAVADLRDLRLGAQLHSLVAEGLWAAERKAQSAARADSAADPIAVIDRGRDRAALISVDRADELVRRRQFAAAAEEYAQTIRLFPTTKWAAVARQRLASIENRKDG